LRTLRSEPGSLQAPSTDQIRRCAAAQSTGKIHKPTLRENFGSEKTIDINHVAP
jgi:hypothetical protein